MNETTKNKKILIIPFIIAILLAIASIVMVITGIEKYSDAKEDYKIEMEQYERDKDAWFNNPGMYDMPDHPGFGPNLPFVTFLGIGAFLVCVSVCVYSFSPILEKKAKAYQRTVSGNSAQNTEVNIFDLIKGKQTYKCEYCGSVVASDKSRCDSCGASIKK